MFAYQNAKWNNQLLYNTIQYNTNVHQGHSIPWSIDFVSEIR